MCFWKDSCSDILLIIFRQINSDILKEKSCWAKGNQVRWLVLFLGAFILEVFQVHPTTLASNWKYAERIQIPSGPRIPENPPGGGKVSWERSFWVFFLSWLCLLQTRPQRHSYLSWPGSGSTKSSSSFSNCSCLFSAPPPWKKAKQCLQKNYKNKRRNCWWMTLAGSQTWILFPSFLHLLTSLNRRWRFTAHVHHVWFIYSTFHHRAVSKSK